MSFIWWLHRLSSLISELYLFTDYYERTSIDCDHVFELEGGWVLGGVHQHPTPHIAIVAPSLPASGDHTPYLTALLDRAKNKGGEWIII